MSDDGSLWTVDGELEDLLVMLTNEVEGRADFLSDTGDAEGVAVMTELFTNLANRSGFDASVILRLVKICAYQQERIEQLTRWAEAKHPS